MTNAKSKIEAKFNAMNSEELFGVMRELNNDDREEAYILIDIATDVYMSKVPEHTFVRAMEILEEEMDY